MEEVWKTSGLRLEPSSQLGINRIEELLRVEIMLAVVNLVAMDTYSKILRHSTALYDVDTDLFEGLTERDECFVTIELTTEL